MSGHCLLLRTALLVSSLHFPLQTSEGKKCASMGGVEVAGRQVAQTVSWKAGPGGKRYLAGTWRKKNVKKSESADALELEAGPSVGFAFECNKKQAGKCQIEKIDCGCECLTA